MKLTYLDGIQKLFAGYLLPSLIVLNIINWKEFTTITVDGFADKFVLGEKINDRQERKALWDVKEN